ncbi:MAG: ATP-dependent 6-phosphofructokinase [Betaproteobacteria bacterium]|nr:ATP-dependent 6-phosphofructokinase [Betaproteobacteria bacterium]
MTKKFSPEAKSEFYLGTTIEKLGPCKVDSLLPFNVFADDRRIKLFLDKEHAEELTTPVSVEFEAAGPRKKLYFDPSRAKCAIVTCGGLCPGINDVIRALVMEAHHQYKVPAILGISYGLEGFIPTYRHKVWELTPDMVSDMHLYGGTMLGSSRGPQSAEAIVDSLERMNISCLFIIGGDGTLKAASAIVKEIRSRGLRISVIGIPKTIDNDINFVPQSFGFETAVDKATEAIQCAHTEAEGAHNGIGLVKLMGRESGFIAAQATLSLKEVNFVLIPEAPFVLDGPGGLLPALEKRLLARQHAVIVAAEGAGQHLMRQVANTDASGNVVLNDVLILLKDAIQGHFKKKGISIALKTIDPSYIIRSVPANANDRVYCGFLGQHAVHAAMAGKTNMVVAKIMDRYVHVPLDLIIRKRRKLNIYSDFWRAVLESTGQGGLVGMIQEEGGAAEEK